MEEQKNLSHLIPSKSLDKNNDILSSLSNEENDIVYVS